MGRPPLPISILKQHGETRPSRINRPELKPRGNRPRMPRDMAPAAREIWRRVVAEMEPTGVLTAVDQDMLRAYCEVVARARYAASLLEQSGPLLRGRNGDLVKSPLNQVVRDNLVLMRMLGRELALTPSARAAVRGAPEIADQDPFSAFLDGTDG